MSTDTIIDTDHGSTLAYDEMKEPRDLDGGGYRIPSDAYVLRNLDVARRHGVCRRWWPGMEPPRDTRWWVVLPAASGPNEFRTLDECGMEIAEIGRGEDLMELTEDLPSRHARYLRELWGSDDAVRLYQAAVLADAMSGVAVWTCRSSSDENERALALWVVGLAPTGGPLYDEIVAARAEHGDTLVGGYDPNDELDDLGV